jgi:tRNA U34 5-carboxymethylaminomethyl modifying enzyme MnmG/GidA
MQMPLLPLRCADYKGPRAQIDRKLYKKHMQEVMFHYPNLDVRAASVFDIVLDSQPDMSSASSPGVTRVNGLMLGKCSCCSMSLDI